MKRYKMILSLENRMANSQKLATVKYFAPPCPKSKTYRKFLKLWVLIGLTVAIILAAPLSVSKTGS
jgi:hypothetical protein